MKPTLVIAAVLAMLVAAYLLLRARGESESDQSQPTTTSTTATQRQAAQRPPALPATPAREAVGVTKPAFSYQLEQLSPSHVGVRLVDSQSSLTIRTSEDPLPPDRTVSGRVVDDAGRPVAGAVVLAGIRIGSFVPSSWLTASHGAVSDDEGRYRLRVVHSSDAAVMALHNEAGWSRLVALPPGKEDAKIDLHLEAPGQLRGTVTYAGQPAPIRAELLSRGPGSLNLHATTEADGRYRFDALPAGEYSLRVGLDHDFDTGNARTVTEEVSILPGRTTSQDVELPVGVTMSIYLDLPEGTVLKMVGVSLEHEATARESFDAHQNYPFRVDRDKATVYHDVEPGPYRLCVETFATIEDEFPPKGNRRCEPVVVKSEPQAQQVRVRVATPAAP